MMPTRSPGQPFDRSARSTITPSTTSRKVRTPRAWSAVTHRPAAAPRLGEERLARWSARPGGPGQRAAPPRPRASHFAGTGLSSASSKRHGLPARGEHHVADGLERVDVARRIAELACQPGEQLRPRQAVEPEVPRQVHVVVARPPRRPARGGIRRPSRRVACRHGGQIPGRPRRIAARASRASRRAARTLAARTSPAARRRCRTSPGSALSVSRSRVARQVVGLDELQLHPPPRREEHPARQQRQYALPQHARDVRHVPVRVAEAAAPKPAVADQHHAGVGQRRRGSSRTAELPRRSSSRLRMSRPAG